MVAVPRSKRLAVVLDLAVREEEAAAKTFQHAQRIYAEEQHKLTQLREYFAEYQSHFASIKQLRVEELVKQRSFLQQLTQAQNQQQAQLQRMAELLEQQRQTWQRAHLKRQKMAELIERYKADENLALGKQEQKMLDEWYLQSISRR